MMLSSTSNSSTRVPARNWLLTWLSVTVIVAVSVAGWELFLRNGGLGQTAVSDSAELWIHERERASLFGDGAIILVGASRMQMGVDLQVMNDANVGNPVQLAISASPFLPVFEHLANDETITGTVIVSLTVADMTLSTRDFPSQRWTDAYDQHKAGKTSVFYQPLEDYLREAVDSLFPAFASGARPQHLLLGSTTKSYVRTLPNRSQQADYRNVDRELAYQRRVELILDGRAVSPEEIPEFHERVAYLESLVSRITQRGGEVIFVRLPSSKRIREIEDIRYPRSIYWDQFASRTSARAIHYADHPELSDFDFVDGIHIDVADQAAYTQALVNILFDTPTAK